MFIFQIQNLLLMEIEAFQKGSAKVAREMASPVSREQHMKKTQNWPAVS